MFCHRDFALRAIEQQFGCQHGCLTCETWEHVQTAKDTLCEFMDKYNENADNDDKLPICLTGGVFTITASRVIPYAPDAPEE